MQGVIDYVGKCFDVLKTNAEDRIKNAMAKKIRGYKKLKDDGKRVESLSSLLGTCISIYITEKESFDAELLKPYSKGGLTTVSGYSKLLGDAIGCLREKERIDEAIKKIEKDIESNEKIITEIIDYETQEE